jgi:hypothetical protein
VWRTHLHLLNSSELSVTLNRETCFPGLAGQSRFTVAVTSCDIS